MPFSGGFSIPSPRCSAEDCEDFQVPSTPSVALTRLLEARAHLRQASRESSPARCYAAAYLAALRVAAAIALDRSQLADRRPQSAWKLLDDAVPEYTQWAQFFAARSQRRLLAESGSSSITAAEAAEMQQRAAEFLQAASRGLSGVAR